MTENNLKITYKGQDIVDTDISTETTKTLKTAGKYCEADIIVNAQGGSGGNLMELPTIKEKGTYSVPPHLKELEYLITDGVHYIDTKIFPDFRFYVKDLDFAPRDYSMSSKHIIGSSKGNGQNDPKTIIYYYGNNTAGMGGISYYINSSNKPVSLDGLYYIGEIVNLSQTKLSTTELANNVNGEQVSIMTVGALPNIGEISFFIGGTNINNSSTSLASTCIGHLQLNDFDTDEVKIDFRPFIDDDDNVWYYLNGFYYLAPEGWTAGGIKQGGLEINYDGFESPVIVDIDTLQYGLPYKTFFKINTSVDLSDLDLGSEVLPSYALSYKFNNIGQNMKDVVFTGTTIKDHALNYTFQNCKATQPIDVKMPNVTSIETYGLQYTFNNTSSSNNQKVRDVLIGGDSNITLGTYALTYAFNGYGSLRNVTVRGLKTVTATSAFDSTFRGASTSGCTLDGELSFPDLETINGSSCFSYTFAYRSFNRDNAMVINPFPKLTEAKGTSVFGHLFYYCKTNENSIFVFPKLKYFANSNTSTQANAMFQYCYGYWKYCWFLALEEIGYAGTSSISTFSNSFNGTSITNCFQICMPNLKKIISISSSSTATYGNFNACNMMSKIWLPQLNDITGTPHQNNLFNGCTQSGLEIHFGKENETYIKSLSGYAKKFGATKATIFFDCINHITVNGTVYNRDGENYIVSTTNQTSSSTYEFTHADDRYSWKDSNGNIIYTLECWTPSVGDNVLDASDNIIGTIGAIA